MVGTVQCCLPRPPRAAYGPCHSRSGPPRGDGGHRGGDPSPDTPSTRVGRDPGEPGPAASRPAGQGQASTQGLSEPREEGMGPPRPQGRRTLTEPRGRGQQDHLSPMEPRPRRRLQTPQRHLTAPRQPLDSPKAGATGVPVPFPDPLPSPSSLLGRRSTPDHTLHGGWPGRAVGRDNGRKRA